MIIFKWVCNCFVWLLPPRIFFVYLLFIMMAITPIFYTYTEQTIRYSGYKLQMLGMIIAILGLIKIGKFFNIFDYKDSYKKWLSKRPKLKIEVSMSAQEKGSDTADFKATIRAWKDDVPENDIEKRVSALYEISKSLHLENLKLHQANSELKSKLENLRDDTSSKLTLLEAVIRQDWKYTQTNGLNVSIMGLILLTIGITMSTLSPELARLSF